jgi:hypothetical protein
MLAAAFVWNYLGIHMKANEQSPRSKEEIFDTDCIPWPCAQKLISRRVGTRFSRWTMSSLAVELRTVHFRGA